MKKQHANKNARAKHFDFLAKCNSSKKRLGYLKDCKNLPGLVKNVQGSCGLISKIGKSFSSTSGKKLLKNSRTLAKISKNTNLARKQTLTGGGAVRDVLRFVSRNPEILKVAEKALPFLLL